VVIWYIFPGFWYVWTKKNLAALQRCRLSAAKWIQFVSALNRNEVSGMVMHQGCQMVYFQTKNPTFGKNWRVLQRKLFVYFIIFGLFTAVLYIFRSFGILWFIFPRFGVLHQETSGNPAMHCVLRDMESEEYFPKGPP
jgi:hypothetical protein